MSSAPSDVWSTASTAPVAGQRAIVASPPRNARAPKVGSKCQVYSKAKDVWCNGKVLRIINGEAAEVEYAAPGGKKRVKMLRLDSENLSYKNVSGSGSGRKMSH